MRRFRDVGRAMTEAFDLATETSLLGTCSRIGRYVRGDCAKCDEKDALVYDTLDDPTLLCAECSRKRAVANPRVEICDDCGATPAWRDPVTRKNEFFCIKCHVARGKFFQNRWARAAEMQSNMSIGMHKAVCAAAGYGTDCKGEIKWRGPYNKELCNKHAGVKSSNPANN